MKKERKTKLFVSFCRQYLRSFIK